MSEEVFPRCETCDIVSGHLPDCPEAIGEPLDAEVSDQVAILPFLDPYAPAGGWHPDDFPSLSVAIIPYTTNALVRADPSFTINTDGWMFLELGNVRLAIPDREEWAKLINIGERLWNTHERDVASKSTPVLGDEMPTTHAFPQEELDGVRPDPA